MMRWIVLVLLVGLAACDMSGAPLTPTVEVIPTATPVRDEWTRVSADGVQLSVRPPSGWQSITNEYGILLAEHAGMTGDTTPHGILVYIFVQKVHDLGMPITEGGNLAWDVLNNVTQRQEYVGNSTVTDTVAIRWGERDAAYYLLSDSDGNYTFVLAMVMPSAEKLVVCNITTTAEDADRIREMLPRILENVMVDGAPLDESIDDLLPDPLVFPEAPAETTDEPSSESTADW